MSFSLDFPSGPTFKQTLHNTYLRNGNLLNGLSFSCYCICKPDYLVV